MTTATITVSFDVKDEQGVRRLGALAADECGWEDEDISPATTGELLAVALNNAGMVAELFRCMRGWSAVRLEQPASDDRERGPRCSRCERDPRPCVACLADPARW